MELKKAFLTFLFIMANVLTIMSQDQASDAEILHLLELTNIPQTYLDDIDMHIGDYVKQYASTPDSAYYARYYIEMKKAGFEAIQEDYIKIYKENYSKEEIEAMINFYGSETGKSITQKTPKVIKESYELSSLIADEISAKVSQELEAENLELFEKVIEADCSRFKTGELEYLFQGTRIQVTRSLDEQIEQYFGNEIKFKVIWLSNNRYKLVQKYKTEEGDENVVLEVNIYEVNGDSYKYIFKNNKYDGYFFGEMTKLAENR